MINFNRLHIAELISLKKELSNYIKEYRSNKSINFIHMSNLIITKFVSEIKSTLGVSLKGRKQKDVLLKHAMINCIFQSKYYTSKSDIGRHFGLDHSTIIYILSKHNDRMESNMYPDYQEYFKKSKKILDEIIRKEQAN